MENCKNCRYYYSLHGEDVCLMPLPKWANIDEANRFKLPDEECFAWTPKKESNEKL